MLNKIQYFILALLISSLGAFAQQVNVVGNMTDFKDKEITMYYYVAGKPVSDKVNVVDGKFKWTAVMPEPQMVSMLGSRRYDFFLEAGRISITSVKAGELNIKGSRVQDEYEAYLKTLNDLDLQQSELFKNWEKGSKDEQKALEAKVATLNKEKKERANRYIAAHPKSAVSLYLVSDRAVMGDYSDVIKIYDQLSDQLKLSAGGKRVTERLVVLKRSDIGQPMLDFTQNNQEGKAIRFADFKGKYVLIDFWASWCGPCRAENPNVLKAYNQYKDKNFTVIGISLDDKVEKWTKAIKEDQMPWTQVSDLKGFENEIADYYGIRAIPCTFLLNPEGKIIATYLRGDALNEKLAELLN